MHNIFIHEVGPRDGLQAEKTIVPLAEKIRWERRIAFTPLAEVEKAISRALASR